MNYFYSVLQASNKASDAVAAETKNDAEADNWTDHCHLDFDFNFFWGTRLLFCNHSYQTVVKVHLHNCLFCHPLFADWTSATQKNNSRLNKVCSYSTSMCQFFYILVANFGGQLWMLPTLKFMLSILSNDQPLLIPLQLDLLLMC